MGSDDEESEEAVTPVPEEKIDNGGEWKRRGLGSA